MASDHPYPGSNMWAGTVKNRAPSIEATRAQVRMEITFSSSKPRRRASRTMRAAPATNPSPANSPWSDSCKGPSSKIGSGG